MAGPCPEPPRGGGPPQDPPAGSPGPEPDVWDTLARWRAARRRFVLLTVVETRGYTPRKAGARMLVAEDGGIAGTIGGGAIEREALEAARGLFAKGGTALLKRHLTQELGMCCGGEMTVFLEAQETAPKLWLFGAGYVAKPLAAMAVTCGFEVTVVDERAEWADPARFPGATVLCREPEAALHEIATGPGDYALVLTHDHALDQRLVEGLLRRPLRFLGMIGSSPKGRKFALRLRARGFGPADLERLHTPLGLPIGAATPEEIAVSAMAQLVAVRRGVPVEPGWVPPERGPETEEAAARGRAAEENPHPTEVEPR